MMMRTWMVPMVVLGLLVVLVGEELCHHYPLTFSLLHQALTLTTLEVEMSIYPFRIPPLWVEIPVGYSQVQT